MFCELVEVIVDATNSAAPCLSLTPSTFELGFIDARVAHEASKAITSMAAAVLKIFDRDRKKSLTTCFMFSRFLLGFSRYTFCRIASSDCSMMQCVFALNYFDVS